jgi:transposase
MSEVSTIGLDLAKNVFQMHGADASGAVLFRKKLRRDQVLKFLAAQPACTVAMEACASSHYWGREIARLGHEVRLIAPDYVKPFVKRQKNDAADAEAICEAVQRPTMRFVAAKSEEQQAAAIVFRARDLLGASAHSDHQCDPRPSGRIRDGSGARPLPCSQTRVSDRGP